MDKTQTGIIAYAPIQQASEGAAKSSEANVEKASSKANILRDPRALSRVGERIALKHDSTARYGKIKQPNVASNMGVTDWRVLPTTTVNMCPHDCSQHKCHTLRQAGTPHNGETRHDRVTHAPQPYNGVIHSQHTTAIHSSLSQRLLLACFAPARAANMDRMPVPHPTSMTTLPAMRCLLCSMAFI